MIIRQILDVLITLIFVSIVIYTSLLTLTCLYLFTINYVLLVLLCELNKTDKIWAI